MDDMIDYAGAETATGIKKSTLYALVVQNRIPHVRYGRRFVRFSRSELAKWILEHSVPAGIRSKRGRR
jgi:excisionase family DNA binding protein